MDCGGVVMSTLNPNAEKWVRALESGRFKQGYGQLAQGDERCCLGVLCDRAVDAGVIKNYTPDAAMLSWPVAKWAGLKWRNPEYSLGLGQGMTRKLAVDNDRGKSFAEIAQIIRDNADTLFVEA